MYENQIFQGDIYSQDHRGCRCLTLHNEERDRQLWILDGQYWTDKSVETKNNLKGGTLGRIEMKWIREDKATETDHDVIEFLNG